MSFPDEISPAAHLAREPDPVEVLIAQAKAGSREGLGELLERYRPLLHRHARKLLDAQLQAKIGDSEIVQETLLAALVAFPEFNGASDDQIGAWLLRIMSNRISDVRKGYRAAKRDVRRERPLVYDIPSKSTEAGGRSSFEWGPEMKGFLGKTFMLLAPEHQLVVKLRYHEKLPFEEVATIMDRSIDAVKKLWCRALRDWSREAEALQRHAQA